jgi:general secretion pathway protein G
MEKDNSGFTLIELLVVISIVGLLASSLLANLEQTRGQARDTVRISDMRAIKLALEAFYNEHKRYPGVSDGVVLTGNYIGIGDPIDTALAPYLPNIPKDPLHDGSIYFYSYDPAHCTDSVPGNCDCLGPNKAIFAFNRAEDTAGLQKDTCSGPDMNIENADFNQALFERGI